MEIYDSINNQTIYLFENFPKRVYIQNKDQKVIFLTANQLNSSRDPLNLSNL
jgi:hypothetical protein